ncbi:MAG: S8 family peptidase [Armatimonadetes bacterium]|nr:S8 family peptidase [Armatimonadota bacterium]
MDNLKIKLQENFLQLEENNLSFNNINNNPQSIKKAKSIYLNKAKVNLFKAPRLNFPALGVHKLHNLGYTGKGIGIAIIDSGIYSHPDFKDRIIAFKDFVNERKETYDDCGHGTHIAGIAAGDGKISKGKVHGVAPKADLISLKVINAFGSAELKKIAEALNWCIKNKEKYHIKIINLSLNTQSDDLNKIIKEAIKNGIIVVVSAGNDGLKKNNTITLPGKIREVITVANLDQNKTEDEKDDKINPSSSRGIIKKGLIKPDISAPGTKIYASYAPDGNLINLLNYVFGDNRWDADKDGKADYIPLSGTSMSAPFISGLAALMLQANPDLTPNEIKYILMNTAKPLKNIDYNAQGKGVVNPEKALRRAIYLKKV